MDTTSVDTAARHLLAARKSHRAGDRLPERDRPADAEAGLAIQRRVGALLGQTIGGWKCSVPTAARKFPTAAIYQPTIRHASPCAIIGLAGMARIEPEIAFVVGRDLPPRTTPYSDDEIRASMRETRLVLELIGPRSGDPSTMAFPELLADSIANQGLFVGPVVVDAMSRPLAGFPIAVDSDDGILLTREGQHPDGHPLPPLYWLANFLAAGGYGEDQWLRAGQVVTTGSYCGVIDVPLETALWLRYGDLGVLPIRFSALPAPATAKR